MTWMQCAVRGRGEGRPVTGEAAGGVEGKEVIGLAAHIAPMQARRRREG